MGVSLCVTWGAVILLRDHSFVCMVYKVTVDEVFGWNSFDGQKISEELLDL